MIFVASRSRGGGQGETVRSHLLELVDTGNVPRLAAQLTQELLNRNVRAVHQDGPNSRAQRADVLEEGDRRGVADTGVDHHQVEIFEAALPDRTVGIHCRTNIDAILVGDVRHRRRVTSIEIDNEQTNGRIHHCVA